MASLHRMEIYMCIPQVMCPSIHSSVFLIVQAPQVSVKGNTDNGIIYENKRATQMHLETIMWNERSQTQKRAYCRILLVKGLKSMKSQLRSSKTPLSEVMEAGQWSALEGGVGVKRPQRSSGVLVMICFFYGSGYTAFIHCATVHPSVH
uniref:Uncharacterized protein n=1 Tax=Molossus molossus TaxID=27622 RepID=A0A7J8JWJ7_MOLMO|nr:hypothetical protein HJG59_008097 [Molossus molossus]